VVRRHRHVHRVVDQVPELNALVEPVELRLREPAVLEDEGQLELGSAQHRHRLLGLLLDEGELHLGVAAREQRHGRRKQGRPRRGKGGHAYPPAAHAGNRLQLRLGGGQPGDHHLRVLDQRTAGVGERDPAAAAVDERGAGLLLEGGDLLRDGGLGVGQGIGRGGERAVLRDRLQDPQLFDVEHNQSLSEASQVRI
jgi:hypothetical protein